MRWHQRKFDFTALILRLCITHAWGASRERKRLIVAVVVIECGGVQTRSAIEELGFDPEFKCIQHLFLVSDLFKSNVSRGREVASFDATVIRDEEERIVAESVVELQPGRVVAVIHLILRVAAGSRNGVCQIQRVTATAVPSVAPSQRQ